MIDNLSNPVLQQIAQTQQQRANEQQQAGQELGQDAFLQLMIAQLNNQDPLNPQENGEFIAQLAQFSTVEGITNVNNSIQALVSESRSGRTVNAASLVGKTVEIDGNTSKLVHGSAISGSYALNTSAPSATLTVLNDAGATVYSEDLGSVPAGEHRFSWSGTGLDGQLLPEGTYRIEVTALQGDSSIKVPIRTAEQVQSVYLNEENQVILNLASGQSVPIDAARRLSGAPDASTASLLDGYQSSRVLLGTGLIGENVDYRVGSVQYNPGDPALSASVDLPVGVDRGYLEVRNANNELVFRNEVTGTNGGNAQINWQGVDNSGARVAAGEYQLSFVADVAGEPTQLAIVDSGTVDSVTTPQAGPIVLNLSSGQSIRVDQLLSQII